MKLSERIKVLVFDYDGTLVDYEQHMSEYTKDALIKLKENGYKLALASGRTCSMCKRVVDEVIDSNTFDFIFGGNGAEYMDTNTGIIEKMHYIDIPEIVKIMKSLENTIGIPVIYNDDVMNVPSWVDIDKYSNVFKWTVNPFEKIEYKDINYTVPKVMYLFNEKDYEIVINTLHSINLDGYYLARTRPVAIEIIPNGVSKGNAIDMLIDNYGYKKEEIMSFGDEENDLPMLNKSIGVIMDNARMELKKGADYICDDVREGGIYSFLIENGFFDNEKK